jgi:hypothetical protein
MFMNPKKGTRLSRAVWNLNQFLLTGVARSVVRENQGLFLKTD